MRSEITARLGGQGLCKDRLSLSRTGATLQDFMQGRDKTQVMNWKPVQLGGCCSHVGEPMVAPTRMELQWR